MGVFGKFEPIWPTWIDCRRDSRNKAKKIGLITLMTALGPTTQNCPAPECAQCVKNSCKQQSLIWRKHHWSASITGLATQWEWCQSWWLSLLALDRFHRWWGKKMNKIVDYFVWFHLTLFLAINLIVSGDWTITLPLTELTLRLGGKIRVILSWKRNPSCRPTNKLPTERIDLLNDVKVWLSKVIFFLRTGNDIGRHGNIALTDLQ